MRGYPVEVLIMNTIAIALILVVAAIYLVIMFLAYKRRESRKRTLRMLTLQGIDPEILERGDKQAILQDIRKRCSRCQAEDVCERWLKNPAEGSNAFCPNAAAFEELKLV